MVQGRHAEKALSAGLFEIDYLDDVGQHLHHIDQAHHRDDHWQIQSKGHPAHRAAQEQGARVSHEHLGGVEVIDQEGGQPSGHGGGGGDQVAAAVPGRHCHIEEHHRNGDAGSQAVHPVGEVHRIDGAHHDKGGEHHIHDPGDPHDLDVQKGNVQVGGEVAVPPQQYGEGDGRRQLKQELLGGGQPLVGVVAELLQVIHKADGPKHQGEQEHHQMVVQSVLQVLPPGGEHGGPDAQNEHQTAHGGGTLLGEVPGGAVLPDLLAGLQLVQFRNEKFADEQRQHKADACRDQ